MKPTAFIPDPVLADAEQSCIGAVLLSPDAFYRAELDEEEFFDPRHSRIWSAIQRLAMRGKLVADILAIADEIGPQLESVGGIPYLARCLSAVPTATNVGHYASVVRREARRRRLYLALSQQVAEIASEPYGDNEAPDDREGRVYSALVGVRRGRSADDARPMADLVVEEFRAACDRADTYARGEAVMTGVPTGIAEYDFALGGGLDFGVVNVIAGRPSDGKSALMAGVADAIVVAGWPLYYLSLEDGSSDLVRRRLAAHSRLNLAAIRSGNLGIDALKRLSAAADDLRRANHWLVDDRRGLSIADIVLRIRRYRATLDPDGKGFAVVVDYLQRIRTRGDRKEGLGEAMRMFDDTCAELRICGILGWQLNREMLRDGVEPEMHHLGDTGAGEQVARTISVPWHERTPDGAISSSRLKVLKNKHGRRGLKVPVWFDEETTCFRPAAQPWERGNGA